MEDNTHRASVQAANATVCHCRQIDRLTLEQSIRQGAKSLDAISRLTGAGSECGCCQVYIKELLGEKLWLPVRLASVHRYSDNYCAFRLVRIDGGRWSQEKPGAYFIFQSQINGAWVGRPYAITDDGADSGFREITVKRKAGGFYSNWLFDHLDTLADASLRISASVGGSAFNPDNPKPIICFVGGVGITPALALCRLLAKNQGTAKVCLDYSASNQEDFFCRDELLQIAQHRPLSINFRQTASSGRIRQADVDAIVQQHPDENYYVCGPDSYKTTVIELLRNRDVTPLQIIDLESSHTKAEMSENRTPAVEANVIWGYRLVGFLLLMAYGLQDAFGLKLAALEQLQNEHNYKIISGLLLLVYALMQWRLPIARWLKLGNDKLAVKKHRHQYFGAIAPLVFYLHATSIGYAYLAALSSVYLANSLLGYGSGEFIAHAYKKAYVFGWTIMHIGLSTSLLFLSGYHAYIAFAYK
jgi:ferredoxin-NADP reductase